MKIFEKKYKEKNIFFYTDLLEAKNMQEAMEIITDY